MNAQSIGSESEDLSTSIARRGFRVPPSDHYFLNKLLHEAGHTSKDKLSDERGYA